MDAAPRLGDGPKDPNAARVRFDLAQRPLPELPLPNDLAAFADPTSRTGLRVNVSTVAPSAMETTLRGAFGEMEGWGTTMPITVAFDRADTASRAEPALDLDDFASRMQGGDHDLSDDPVYLINLRTGVPMFLDAGGGYYPLTLRDTNRYFPGDVKAKEPNLLFETVEEGKGLTQANYRPELDLDFDGVLDHPNTFGRRGLPGIDNLLSWYERETDTLILRPVLPLDERTEYAVVLTDRLRSATGVGIESPFEGKYHPAQANSMRRLEGLLSTQNQRGYFGDLAGTGLARVRFAWAFTTMPVAEDMHLLRSGLYGRGPFARWAEQFPPDAQALAAAGRSPNPDEDPGWAKSNATCTQRSRAPFVVPLGDADVQKTLDGLLRQLFGASAGEAVALGKALSHASHLVLGTYRSPYLVGDPAGTDPDARFAVDFTTGEGDVRGALVPYFLVVPKESAVHKQPFPVAILGHGVTGNASEALLYAGDYARQGVAVMGIDMPGHGAVLLAPERAVAQAAFGSLCLVPFVKAYEVGRAVDLDGDGVPDSGGAWWTAHVAHTRDNVRQGLLDSFQAVRVLRAMDGVRKSSQDYNGDGTADLAGDFDGNGAPDVGGPNVPYFATGESLGSIMAGSLGALEPHVVAASSAGGGGGSLALDVAFRSYGVADSVIGQMMTPLVFAVPAAERPDNGAGKNPSAMGSRCGQGDRSVRIMVNNGIRMHEMEVACLSAAELAENMTVVLSNGTNKEVRCARTGADGRFRLAVPATEGDRFDVQLYPAADVVESYKGCALRAGAPPPGRRIQTFEQAALHPLPVADAQKVCEGERGCAQFQDRFYPVGSQLRSPSDGLGLARQTPELRRLAGFAQAAFDAADPANFAPYYARKALTDEHEARVPPRALLAVNTIGDAFVPIAAGLTFARAAGALPFLPPQALAQYPEYRDYVTPEPLYVELGNKTPMRALIDDHVVEGVARLGRSTAGPGCAANYKTVDTSVCPVSNTPPTAQLGCDFALSDPDWISEGAQRFAAPHPKVPLRTARVAGALAGSSAQDLALAFEPRLRGTPFSPDDAAWSARAPVLALFNNYIAPTGAHTWSQPDVCRAFDHAAYGNALIARFFSTRGRDVYYLSHPSSHACLAAGTCPFLSTP